MIVPDINLLIYACDASSPFHQKAAAWLEGVFNAQVPVIFVPPVVFGFVRIATHPRVFSFPLAVPEAAAHVRSWLERKSVRMIDLLPEDVDSALALLEAAGTAGNLTTDAQIAAVALRLDGVVHTADLDFGRFPGLRYVNPLVR
ncbi:MAG: TA system VapC family ribonuclease toxin [Verrucomicrobiota bacterium]